MISSYVLLTIFLKDWSQEWSLLRLLSGCAVVVEGRRYGNTPDVVLPVIAVVLLGFK